MAYLFPTFISELEERRYSPDSIQRMIRTADRLGHWLQDHGIDLSQANQTHVDQFVLAQGRRPDKRSQHGHLPKSASHITTVTALMRKQGILDGRSNWTDIDQWANRFSVHLLQVCGVTKSRTKPLRSCCPLPTDERRSRIPPDDCSPIGVDQIGLAKPTPECCQTDQNDDPPAHSCRAPTPWCPIRSIISTACSPLFDRLRPFFHHGDIRDANQYT